MMALFDRLTARAEEIAERGRLRVAAAWTDIPGVTISREGERLVLAGRGLMRRWLGDIRLRFARWNNR